jgi:glucose-6-phosphate isomerase
VIAARLHLDPIAEAVQSAVDDLVAREAVEALWGRDHTLFGPDPTECADRMGWLTTWLDSVDAWEGLAADAEQIAAEADTVVVMGMGGSSLFPEVLAQTFGAQHDFPRLRVIDSTHPAAVARLTEECDSARTFHVAASKSGSTVETRSHLAHFWSRSGEPTRFGVITDPGSALGALARERGYRHVWENDPDIGGRYSALSRFGMVPAALAGLDGPAMLAAAEEMADGLAPGDDDANLGLWLGVAIAVAARAGRDKLTLRLDPRIEAFGLWLEQLVAESLGKRGVGVVPVVGEPPEVAIAHPDDRIVVAIGSASGLEQVTAAGAPTIALTLEETTDLGAQVLLWEFATAIAGAVLGVNPFDQPDVEAAKAAARAILEHHPAPPASTPLEQALATVRPGDHLAIGAFVDPEGPVAAALPEVRARLGRALGVATTWGLGPRFLHSTGQLHKGGGHNLVFLQVVDEGTHDVPIPDQPFTFGELIAAQAAGDLEALRAAGQRAFRVGVEELLTWR